MEARMAKRAAGEKARRRAGQAGHQARSQRRAGRGRKVSVGPRLEAIERSLAEMAATLEELRATVARKGRVGRQVERTSRGMESVLRKLYLADHELPFPHRLTANRFGILSDSDEDGITLAIFREAGVSNSRFVEIGCGANGGNSGFLARELGWSGLMVDQNLEMVAIARARFNAERVNVVQSWVTRETVNDLLEEHGAVGEIDLLSIDIDGNDYWVWEAIEACSPRLAIIECNERFGPDRAVAVPYDPDFERHRDSRIYYGASLAAMVHLGRRKGYRLVAMEPYGPNAYLLRDDIAPAIPAAESREVFHVVQKGLETSRGKKQRDRQRDPEKDLYAYIEERRLPLVELPAH